MSDLETEGSAAPIAKSKKPKLSRTTISLQIAALWIFLGGVLPPALSFLSLLGGDYLDSEWIRAATLGALPVIAVIYLALTAFFLRSADRKRYRFVRPRVLSAIALLLSILLVAVSVVRIVLAIQGGSTSVNELLPLVLPLAGGFVILPLYFRSALRPREGMKFRALLWRNSTLVDLLILTLLLAAAASVSNSISEDQQARDLLSSVEIPK